MYIIITKNQSVIDLAKKQGEQIFKLNSENSAKEISVSSINNTEDIVNDFLITMGIPAHIQGFYYLKFILIKFLNEPNLKIRSMTKEIYPCIAKNFNSTTSSVERAIRHAIDTAFSRGSQELQDKVFGFSIKLDNCKPTNSEFIHASKNYLTKSIE